MAVSQFTKELIKTYQIPAKNFYHLQWYFFTQSRLSPRQKTTLSKFKIKQKYFLAVGTLNPTRTIPLISAFAQFLKNTPYTMVIAGKKATFATLPKLSTNSNQILKLFYRLYQ